MSKFVFQGLHYRLKDGNPADVAHLINSARKDAMRMEMFHDPSIKIQRWTKPGRYHIRKIFDQVFVDLIYDEKYEKREEEKRYTIESVLDYPVPVWELYSGTYPLIGWAVPLQTDWVEPTFYIEKTDNVTEPKFFFSTRPDLNTIEMYEIYPLDDIGTPDTAVYGGDWDYTVEEFWGEDEQWLSPEHAVLGIAEPSENWVFSVHAVTHCFVNVEGTSTLYWLWMNPSCHRTPAIAVQEDAITNSYFMSFSIENEDHTLIYPPDGYQYWVRYTDGWISESMSIGDISIYDYYEEDHIEFRQWGSLDVGCDTYAYMRQQYSGDTYMSDEHRSVRDIDGYEYDTVGIALWGHQIVKYPLDLERGPISPWCSEPYDASFYGNEDCFEYHNLPSLAAEYTQQLKVKAFCPKYTVEEYIGDSEYGNYNTQPNPQPLDSNSPWDVGIFDFHKNPFFLFSWYDRRGPFIQYGLVWNDEMKLSERFTCDGSYKHPLYAAEEKLGGNARGYFTACGVRLTTFKEITENG